MGHIRLGTLSRSKKWQEVVGLLESDALLDVIAEAAAKASELDLSRASKDPRFQFVSSLLVRLPLLARAPGFEQALADLGVGENALASVTGLLAGLELAIDRQSFELGASSDAGELAKSALLESLSVQLRDGLPTLFEPTPQEIRAALGSFSSGDNFALLARDFFARLTYHSLDYYLSRELANHTGQDRRFGSDASETRCRAFRTPRNVFSSRPSISQGFCVVTATKLLSLIQRMIVWRWHPSTSATSQTV